MNLTEIKQALAQVDQINFILPSGEKVPPHFHITEIGAVTKKFIDCGGTLRNESVINFQLFTAGDFDHRLSTFKLKSIVELSERKLGLENDPIEVEYQGNTIGKYGLDFDGQNFLLISKFTDCLAKDDCGIPTEKKKTSLSAISSDDCCTPGSGCC